MAGQYQLPQLSTPQSSGFFVIDKSEGCTSTSTTNGLLDMLKTYWWVLLLIVVAFLYYKYQYKKKEEHKEYKESRESRESK